MQISLYSLINEGKYETRDIQSILSMHIYFETNNKARYIMTEVCDNTYYKEMV